MESKPYSEELVAFVAAAANWDAENSKHWGNLAGHQRLDLLYRVNRLIEFAKTNEGQKLLDAALGWAHPVGSAAVIAASAALTADTNEAVRLGNAIARAFFNLESFWSAVSARAVGKDPVFKLSSECQASFRDQCFDLLGPLLAAPKKKDESDVVDDEVMEYLASMPDCAITEKQIAIACELRESDVAASLRRLRDRNIVCCYSLSGRNPFWMLAK